MRPTLWCRPQGNQSQCTATTVVVQQAFEGWYVLFQVALFLMSDIVKIHPIFADLCAASPNPRSALCSAVLRTDCRTVRYGTPPSLSRQTDSSIGFAVLLCASALPMRYKFFRGSLRPCSLKPTRSSASECALWPQTSQSVAAVGFSNRGVEGPTLS